MLGKLEPTLVAPHVGPILQRLQPIVGDGSPPEEDACEGWGQCWVPSLAPSCIAVGGWKPPGAGLL